MDHQPHSSDSEFDSQRPPKRFRRSPLESNAYPSSSNGKDHRFTPDQNPSPHSIDLPPLALSILGVEPLDEFVREIADFVHHMICTRPDSPGQVEVEAKIGVLRDKASGNRIQLPILVETSASFFHVSQLLGR